MSDQARRVAVRTLLFWLALVGLGLLGLRRLDTDNSPEVFFPRHSPTLATYRRIVAAFGEHESVRLVASGERLFTVPGLAALAELERRAAAVPGVESALGLAGHHRRFGTWPPADPQRLRRQALDDPLDRGFGWIDRQGERASVLVQIAPADERERRAILTNLRKVAAAVAAGLEVEVVGLPVLNEALDRSTQEIFRQFFPLLVVLAVVLLLIGRGSLIAACLPLAVVLAVEAVTLGALGALGVRLNLVLATLPPLLFAISMATVVHLEIRVRQLGAERIGAEEAVRRGLEQTRWAILWSGATTLLGFASLVIAPLAPVRQLGLATAAGIGVATIAAFTLAPALLRLAPGTVSPRAARLELVLRRLGARLGRLAVTSRGPILAVAAATLVLLVAGIPRLRVETDARRYLSRQHPARLALERLEAVGIGAASLEVLVESAQPLSSNASLVALGALAERWRALPSVLGVVSPSDLVADVAWRAGGGLPLPSPVALAALRGDPQGGRWLAALLTPDDRAARLLVFAPIDGVEPTRTLVAELLATGRQMAPGFELAISGQLPVLLETQQQLLLTLSESFGVTVGAVALLLLVLLRSARLAVLALLPNLLPVLATLGVMGWLDVPLDIATVMVAAVILGVAVDDTLHTLGHLRRLEPGKTRRQALVLVLEHTTPAYLSTGAILIAGFGVCAFSDFAPTARFGALAALAIALAVTADLFLLPALLAGAPEKVEVTEDR